MSEEIEGVNGGCSQAIKSLRALGISEAVSHVLIYSRGDVQTLALTGQVGQAFPQGTGEDEKRILGVVITLPVSVQ